MARGSRGYVEAGKRREIEEGRGSEN